MKQNNDNRINVNNISVGVDAHGDPCKKHRFNISNAVASRVSARGITLIALIITIIILLILAGVALTLTIGENGIINHAKTSKETYSEAQAREKLELTLLDLQADKLIKVEYNETTYINERLTNKGFAVNGDIVLVDGWQFAIDRSVPRIETNLGRGEIETNIVVNVSSQTRADYVNATLTIEIAYENEITEIILNGNSLDVPEKNADGKYVITIDNVTANGRYSVVAKAGDKINIGSTIVSDITEDIEIRNTNELVAFRDRVNNGATFEGKKATLVNDIDLSTVCSQTIGTWTPIGTETKLFKGVFEGKNHIVEGLYVDKDVLWVGLFGRIYGGTIQNLTVKGSVKGRRMAGGVVGESWEGNVINCKNYCTINTAEYGSKYNTNSGDRMYGHVGGVVGKNSGLVEKCANYGQVTGLSCAGGVVGSSAGEKGIVKECFNIAQVKSTETMRDNIGTAGVVGNNQSKVLDVYNKGKVITEGRETAGIIGWQGLGGNAENAYNTGDVVGSDYVGGCVGIMSGDSTVSKNMYNTGKVQGMSDFDEIGKSDSGYLGMVVGRLQAENVLSDYYFNTTQSVMGAWTEEEINTYLGENFTKDINNINDGYPVLKWQVEENTKQSVINE